MFKEGINMKKGKLISTLTALSLIVVPCASLTANAIALAGDGVTYGTVEDFVKNTFGEDAVFEYSPSNVLYLVITPDDIGDFCMSTPYLIVKVKENSDVDLIKAVKENCSSYIDIEKIDDTTYKIFFSDNTKYPNGTTAKEINEIQSSRLKEAFAKSVSFLSGRDDVVSINRCYDFLYESYNSNKRRIIGFSIGVSGDVNFDYEKYSDYVVKSNDINYFSVYYDSEEDYFKRMYDAYVSLTEDYGEENVNMSAWMQESVGNDMQIQTVGENLYTADTTSDSGSKVGTMPLSDLKVIDTKGYFEDVPGYDFSEITNSKIYKYINPQYNEKMHKVHEEMGNIVDPDYEFALYFYSPNDTPNFVNEVFFEFLIYDLPNDEDYKNMSEFLEFNYPELTLKKLDETDFQCELNPDRIGKYQIVSEEKMTEEEMFDIAVDIEDNLGYRFTTVWNQSAGGTEIDFSGDVNNNGVIDIADVVAISAYVNNPENNPLGEQSIINGDVHNTGDGLTASDVLKIQQYIAGIITEL